MSGHTKWHDLRDSVITDPEAKARIAKREQALDVFIVLAQLRQELVLSQQDLAQQLNVTQESISKIERKALRGEDLYLE